jgi:ABC-type phosphate/phosphonate transport system ATPase subunit
LRRGERVHVDIQDLVVHFAGRPRPALDGVRLRLAAGEHIALLGASGSGKTTLLRALVGAVMPMSGTVVVGGMSVYTDRAARRQVRRRTGMVRQRDDLVIGLRAQTNAVLGTATEWSGADWLQVASGRVPHRYRDPLQGLARRHGIAEYLTSRVEHLSGGQRQRVALVRALLPGPDLLLADEPTSGLDPVTARAAVDALQGAHGATVIVSTHDMNVAQRFSRVVGLREGQVIFDGALPDADQLAAIYQSAEVS